MSKLTGRMGPLLSWGRRWCAVRGSLKVAISKWVGGYLIGSADRSRWASRWGRGRILVCVGRVTRVGIAMMLATEAQAATGPYRVVMSKDKPLCNYIAKTYNADTKTYGSIQYDKHRLFNRIPWSWQSRTKRLPIFTPTFRRAIFDIRNDGKKELVLQTYLMLNGIAGSHTYVYPPSSDILTRVDSNKHVLPDEKKHGIFAGASEYFLKDVPRSSEQWVKAYEHRYVSQAQWTYGYIKNRGAKPWGLEPFLDTNYLDVQPFIWHGVNYLSMTQVGSRWFVISKLVQLGKFHDICYLYTTTPNPY